MDTHAIRQKMKEECTEESAIFILITFPRLLDEIDRLREVIRDFRDNYDCDIDAHKYGTPCRCCSAKEALEGLNL